jgi:hypothetical protein
MEVLVTQAFLPCVRKEALRQLLPGGTYRVPISVQRCHVASLFVKIPDMVSVFPAELWWTEPLSISVSLELFVPLLCQMGFSDLHPY